jgi:hypothetical protein
MQMNVLRVRVMVYEEVMMQISLSVLRFCLVGIVALMFYIYHLIHNI